MNENKNHPTATTPPPRESTDNRGPLLRFIERLLGLPSKGPKQRPYEEYIVSVVKDLPESDSLQRLSFLAAEVHAEQSDYWNRFAAVAVLHAGLFVVAVSTGPLPSFITSLLGLFLALIWRRVQLRSLEYVDRWKPAYHGYRRELRLLWCRECPEPKAADRNEWSSTRWAMIVPRVLLVPWVTLLIRAAVNMWSENA